MNAMATTAQDEGDVVGGEASGEAGGMSIESMWRKILLPMPEGRIVQLRGARGIGKTWLAMRTLNEIPGSLYIATEEDMATAVRRRNYIHRRFGGCLFDVVETRDLAVVRSKLATWKDGIVCVDAIHGYPRGLGVDIVRDHLESRDRSEGRVRLLFVDTYQQSLAAGAYADASYHLLRSGFAGYGLSLIEQKNRDRPSVRRFAVDLRDVMGM